MPYFVYHVCMYFLKVYLIFYTMVFIPSLFEHSSPEIEGFEGVYIPSWSDLWDYWYLMKGMFIPTGEMMRLKGEVW